MVTFMMRSLYWKIFLSFWLTTSLVILSTALLTGKLAKQASIPVRERIFINSYANAAVATYESGHHKALNHWLSHLEITKHMKFFLIDTKGDILGAHEVPKAVLKIKKQFIHGSLPEGIFKSDNLIVSHEIFTPSQNTYRLIAVLNTPIAHLTEIPYAGLAIRVISTIIISGIICYFLSIYLTKPLTKLRLAASAIGKGKLETRVKLTKRKDEIAALSNEFDNMAEKLQAMVVAKERLLQDISHELRSPLARLQVAIELAKNTLPASHKANAEFNRMTLEIERLNGLIEEILSLAKLRSAIHQREIQPTNLTSLIQQITHDANYELANQPLKVIFRRTTPLITKVDRSLIHRAIENIIRNAIHYSYQHGLIQIQLRQFEKHIYISIFDNGPGIPKEELDKIFSPFYRVDTSREKKTGGYGLGLAIAKQSIRLHNGKIIAFNRRKGGLGIIIILPLHPD
jgi:two-component system sensor histidine kinase CpxA